MYLHFLFSLTLRRYLITQTGSYQSSWIILTLELEIRLFPIIFFKVKSETWIEGSRAISYIFCWFFTNIFLLKTILFEVSLNTKCANTTSLNENSKFKFITLQKTSSFYNTLKMIKWGFNSMRTKHYNGRFWHPPSFSFFFNFGSLCNLKYRFRLRCIPCMYDYMRIFSIIWRGPNILLW